MGMYSVIVILNDRLHDIRDDSRFGERVYDAVIMWPHNDGNRWVQMHGMGHVVSVGHGDHEQIVTVHRGIGQPLPRDEEEALFRYRRRKANAEKRARKAASGASDAD